MFSAKTELPQKSNFQFKQDDKFFGRLLSKETSMSNPSFRVEVAVPFVWESQPGTPKYIFSEHTMIPTLTPPPSYYFNTMNATKKPKKKPSRFNLLEALFPKLNLKRTFRSSSSLSSLWSSPVGRRRFLSYDGSSFDFRGSDGEEEDNCGSPPSILCFGIHRTTSSNSGFRSCCKRRA